ncbi:hypothetical protein SDJN03_01497, partial [Cucurbita argyrosperma subsp. sororia]
MTWQTSRSGRIQASIPRADTDSGTNVLGENWPSKVVHPSTRQQISKELNICKKKKKKEEEMAIYPGIKEPELYLDWDDRSLVIDYTPKLNEQAAPDRSSWLELWTFPVGQVTV